MDEIELVPRFDVRDDELSALHHLAFHPDDPPDAAGVQPWAGRLTGHSLTWVGAFRSGELVGFAHAVWDGGTHAFVLDTVVHPAVRRRGIGRDLVRAVTAAAFAAGCEWVHVDRTTPGSTRTPAASARLRPASGTGTGREGRPSKALTLEQAEAVLAAAEADDSTIGCYMVVSLLAGRRTEEMRPLTWDHVDLVGKPDADPPVPPNMMVWRSARKGVTPRPGSPGGRWPCRPGAWTPSRPKGQAGRVVREAPGRDRPCGLVRSRTGVRVCGGYATQRGQRSAGVSTGAHGGGPGYGRLDAAGTTPQLRQPAVRRRRGHREDLPTRWPHQHGGDGKGRPQPTPAGSPGRRDRVRPSAPRRSRHVVRHRQNQGPSDTCGRPLTWVGDTGIEPVTSTVSR